MSLTFGFGIVSASPSPYSKYLDSDVRSLIGQFYQLRQRLESGRSTTNSSTTSTAAEPAIPAVANNVTSEKATIVPPAGRDSSPKSPSPSQPDGSGTSLVAARTSREKKPPTAVAAAISPVRVAPAVKPPSQPTTSSQVSTAFYVPPRSNNGSSYRVIATMFAGPKDSAFAGQSYYTGEPIAWKKCGCSLPAPLDHEKGQYPDEKLIIMNAATGAQTVCEIVDVGPWTQLDPYWKTGTAPMATLGTPISYRKSVKNDAGKWETIIASRTPKNKAGIDLTEGCFNEIAPDRKDDGNVEVIWKFAPRKRPDLIAAL